MTCSSLRSWLKRVEEGTRVYDTSTPICSTMCSARMGSPSEGTRVDQQPSGSDSELRDPDEAYG
jgi:hypothetical protein